MPTLFSFGYSGLGKLPNGLRDLLYPHGVDTIVDVRLSPNSRNPAWCGTWESNRTVEKVGLSYVHERGLGNLLYRSGGIEIFELGRVSVLLELLARGKVPAIMCACQSPVKCHRRVVAGLAASLWPGQEPLRIVDLPLVAEPVLDLGL
jgi:uncharacterized protein (DUF488 family)